MMTRDEILQEEALTLEQIDDLEAKGLENLTRDEDRQLKLLQAKLNKLQTIKDHRD